MTWPGAQSLRPEARRHWVTHVAVFCPESSTISFLPGARASLRKLFAPQPLRHLYRKAKQWMKTRTAHSFASLLKMHPHSYRLLFEQISVSRFHRPHHLCVWWKVLKPQREAAHFKLLITLSVTPTVVGFFLFFIFMSHPFRRNLQNFRSRNETGHAVYVVHAFQVCLSLFGAAQNIWKCLASDTLLPESRTYCLWPALEQSVMHSTQSDNVLIVICHVINLLFWHRQCFGRIILPGMNSQWFF